MTKGILDVLDRVRTPARPGPGSVSAANLRALDTVIARRIDGLLAGDYRSSFAGVGTEFHQVRPYQPGDDVRRIDWNVTARTGLTHVRVELAERQLVTWLVVDASASSHIAGASTTRVRIKRLSDFRVAHFNQRATARTVVGLHRDHRHCRRAGSTSNRRRHRDRRLLWWPVTKSTELFENGRRRDPRPTMRSKSRRLRRFFQ